MAVVNKRTHKPTENDVYIGRPSRWGNPYMIGPHGSREQVIEMYEKRMRHMLKGIDGNGWKFFLKKLKGKNLVCYCKPLACHGDVLERLIEETENDNKNLSSPTTY